MAAMAGPARAPSALLLALALAADGCCLGLGLDGHADVDVLASVETPVPAELVLRRSWGGGGRGGLGGGDGMDLVVHAGTDARVEAACRSDEPELQEDATGARVAYRCSEGEAWRPVYVLRD